VVIIYIIMPRLPSNFVKKKKKNDDDDDDDEKNNNSEDEDEDGGYTVVGEDVTDSSASEGEEDDDDPDDAMMAAGEGAQQKPTKQQKQLERPKVWRPPENSQEGASDEMEYDATAYDCLHAFSHEWPSLSFDILRDDMGDERSKFPHAFFMVSGTQADQASKNALSISRVGRLKKTGGGTKTSSSRNNNNNRE